MGRSKRNRKKNKNKNNNKNKQMIINRAHVYLVTPFDLQKYSIEKGLASKNMADVTVELVGHFETLPVFNAFCDRQDDAIFLTKEEELGRSYVFYVYKVREHFLERFEKEHNMETWSGMFSIFEKIETPFGEAKILIDVFENVSQSIVSEKIENIMFPHIEEYLADKKLNDNYIKRI